MEIGLGELGFGSELRMGTIGLRLESGLRLEAES